MAFLTAVYDYSMFLFRNECDYECILQFDLVNWSTAYDSIPPNQSFKGLYGFISN